MSQTGFAEAAVAKMPSYACIGYVEEVPEGKLSAKETYIVQPIKIRAVGPGRSLRTNILYRPEWLDPGFDPGTLSEYDDGGKMLFVYRNTIAGKGSISTLKGLCGSDEAFNALAGTLQGLEDKSISNVENALREFFTVTNEDARFLYVVKQARQKVGEDNDGKGIYELTKNYEVSEYHFLNAENVKRLKTRAGRSKDGSFRVGFDEDEA